MESLQYSTTPASEPAVPTGIPLLNQYLNFRNSYYWDGKAMLEGAGDYTKARIYHFLHLNIASIKAAVMESEKAPLESRVWYSYQNQAHPIYTNQGMGANPTHIARLLDDGSTQLDRYTYNSLGNLTQTIDPLGRTTKYMYAANEIDVLEVQQVNAQGGNDRLATYSWDAQHRPVTITDAAGQPTSFTYNPHGQVTSVTNALGQRTALTYDALGHLLSTDGPLPGLSDRTTFTYDAIGRVRTVTTGDGYAITASYDNFDRVTKVTYPDGTFEETTYTHLDATGLRDRAGRLTTYTYNATRQLTSALDALGRLTALEWCSCGALKKLIDPLNRVTSWEQDLQGRTTAKIFPDGTRETYTYEKTNSRLATIADARDQVRGFAYLADDAQARILYLNAQEPTPAVTFSYDPAYPRLTAMTDGTGVTSYRYGALGASAANRLLELQTPLTGATVRYSYDALGRQTSRTIDGVAQTFARDTAGRITTITNALGAFQYSFQDASTRITGITLPNGQSMTATYRGATGDFRLQQMRNRNVDQTILSQHDYTYDAAGRIIAWDQQSSGNPSLNYTLGYDAGDQLVTAAATGRNYSFSYDQAANLRQRFLNAARTDFTYNILNELQSASPTLAGGEKSYRWDAENRLVGISYPGTNLSTVLRYDGLGRCVEIVEKNGTTETSVKRYVWCGSERCEERNANGTVTRRFYAQGEQAGGASYYYLFDHLGSVREMTDASGALRARYDYDLHGQRTKLTGDLEATVGYTGHFYHAPSGLHFTRFRAYDASTARWLSRDPLAEDAGPNFYAYVGNNPVNAVDPLGLVDYLGAGVAAAGIAGNAVAVAGGSTIAAAGVALALTPTGVGQVIGAAVATGGAAVAANGLYGLGASSANLGAAIAGGDPLSKGSALTDLANKVAPGNAGAQLVAGGVDLALSIPAGPFGGSAKILGAAAKVDDALGAAGTLAAGINGGQELAGALGLGGSGGSKNGTAGKAAEKLPVQNHRTLRDRARAPRGALPLGQCAK